MNGLGELCLEYDGGLGRSSLFIGLHFGVLACTANYELHQPPLDQPTGGIVNAVLFSSKKPYFLNTLLCENCVVRLGTVLSGIRVCGLSAVGDLF
jgi:hypothetical protein